jgi:dihydroorotase
MTMLIRGAKVIDTLSPFHNKRVNIFIDNGIIRAIDEKLENIADTIIEAEDLCVSAGWCDLFADYREPGFEHKETIATGLDSAAAGGFTHVFILPNTNPTISSKSVVQYLLIQSESHAVQLYPIGAISKDIEGKNLAEMLDMHAHGAIAFSDGWKPIQNPNLMLKALEYAKAFDGTLIQLPCDTNLSAGGLMHEGPESTRLGMPGIPTIAETLQLYRDIELLRYTNSKLHVTGISSAESVAMVRRAKAEGLNITCSVTPYHLVFTDEALRGYNSIYKVMPPLRSEADRKALVEGLKDGTIDCITSHHRPQEWDAKAKEFEYASEGMNVQEITFSIVYNALKDIVPIETIVAALSYNPAKIFGLANGKLENNAVADLTLFSLSQRTQKNKLHSLSQNNPFMDINLVGNVIGIVKNKQLILNQNK